MAAKDTFQRKAPKLMDRLLEAFSEWDELDAAACAGNAGHESNGFTAFQEIKPTVKGSRGGYSWFQWTGPRRRKFEAWCKEHGLALTSDEAAIGYTIAELQGPERAAVKKTAQAVGLEAKVKAFEAAFERAGVKHYPSRIKWAEIALAAWENKGPMKVKIKPKEITNPKIVKGVQGLLAGLKYNPGPADGKIGPLTKGAILVFRHDNGLPPLDYIDQPMLDVIEHAEPRKMVPTRANATSAQVATVVPEANAHWWNKYLAGGGAGVGIVAAVGDAVAPARGYVDQIRDLGADIPGYIWLILFALFCSGIAYMALHGQKAVDEAYRKGDRR